MAICDYEGHVVLRSLRDSCEEKRWRPSIRKKHEIPCKAETLKNKKPIENPMKLSGYY